MTRSSGAQRCLRPSAAATRPMIRVDFRRWGGAGGEKRKKGTKSPRLAGKREGGGLSRDFCRGGTSVAGGTFYRGTSLAARRLALGRAVQGACFWSAECLVGSGLRSPSVPNECPQMRVPIMAHRNLGMCSASNETEGGLSWGGDIFDRRRAGLSDRAEAWTFWGVGMSRSFATRFNCYTTRDLKAEES
ncbi:hypothetical protein LY76DRAFT_173976 [Colletotrichum caudatum]|nr:hypothetical protein LY76DRAFT_173976 [Colletotrichum caudatum]